LDRGITEWQLVQRINCANKQPHPFDVRIPGKRITAGNRIGAAADDH
jgi:hypothetical protein